MTAQLALDLIEAGARAGVDREHDVTESAVQRENPLDVLAARQIGLGQE